jgi:hypothetical protein
VVLGVLVVVEEFLEDRQQQAVQEIPHQHHQHKELMGAMDFLVVELLEQVAEVEQLLPDLREVLEEVGMVEQELQYQLQEPQQLTLEVAEEVFLEQLKELEDLVVVVLEEIVQKHRLLELSLQEVEVVEEVHSLLLAVPAVVASSSCVIPKPTQSPTPAAGLHLPLQQMAAIK